MELGSGIGNIREVIPQAARTDLFPNPWIDRTEDIYQLSMASGTCANLILFDVFHHLEYPMDALDACRRVLRPGGRVLVFDHAMSLAGFLFSKFVHHEKAGFNRPFRLRESETKGSEPPNYYADHANADRILCRGFRELLAKDWRMVETIKMPALAWLASGGYRGPCWIQNPEGYGWRLGEALLSQMPAIFALRLLVVLEKNPADKKISK